MNTDENIKKWKSYNHIYFLQQKQFALLVYFLLIGFIVLLFHLGHKIYHQGYVTAFNINERTQQLNAIISGSIDKWYIKEGDFVKKGDTILKLNEIKPEYLDMDLLSRTQEQVQAKSDAAVNYTDKATTANVQVLALQKH